MRIGLGFDAHAFDSKGKLVLGGVEIEDAHRLSGHSDGDVVCHAIADALLGAARLGDLGDFFPADERWRDASSLEILRHTNAALKRAGWEVVNIDATVVAERPALSSHRPVMCERIAEALGVPVGSVSLKATTADGLGFTGREEGIAGLAVALIDRIGH
jgi:2-C-methyl-D-erythritol 2,4-cyclodiphosphate synthase